MPEFLLQIILQRNDYALFQYAHGQHDIRIPGRSVRLDILAVDEENHVYNIEECSATIKVLALNVLDITAV